MDLLYASFNFSVIAASNGNLYRDLYYFKMQEVDSSIISIFSAFLIIMVNQTMTSEFFILYFLVIIRVAYWLGLNSINAELTTLKYII